MSKRKFYICDIFVYLLVKKKVFLFFYWKAFLIKCVRKSNINFRLPLSVFLNQFLSLRYYDICKIIYLRARYFIFVIFWTCFYYYDMHVFNIYRQVIKKTRDDKFFQYLNFVFLYKKQDLMLHKYRGYHSSGELLHTL